LGRVGLASADAKLKKDEEANRLHKAEKERIENKIELDKQIKVLQKLIKETEEAVLAKKIGNRIKVIFRKR
jgi:hypothetical protein